MNKEKIIDGIIVAGLILQALILIVLACLIFGFAPVTKFKDFIPVRYWITDKLYFFGFPMFGGYFLRLFSLNSLHLVLFRCKL